MSEVLEFLGPLDRIFPASEADPCLGFLRRCVRSNNFFMGSLIHAHLAKSGLKDEILVSNVMLFVYSKAGFLGSCSKVFDEMRERDVVSWCTLISGYVSHGLEIEAFELFKRMMVGGSMPNQFVMSSVLKGCSGCGVLELGLMVHGMVVKSGLGFDRFVETGLVDMYAKCGDLDGALKVFYEIPVKSSVSWNTMISGYVRNEFLVEAVELCREMCRVGVAMDLVTLRVVANAAASLEMFGFCKNLHVYSIKIGFETDTFIATELVRLLSKLGEVDYMCELFKKVRRPDVSLYSLLISGYHLHGRRVEAVNLAKELLALDMNPMQGALVNVLNLCLCKDEGAQIHAHIVKTAHLACLSIGNALISMYVKLGELMDAKTALLGMPVCDVVSWTIIMAGLVQNHQFGEALEAFHALRRAGVQLDQHAIATTVNACMGIGAVANGQQLHALSLKIGFEFSNFIRASLLHMYSKSRHIECAAKLFLCTSAPHDLVLTNIMLAGYCWNSLPHKALKLFSKEYQAGLVPDHFSFSTVLGASADMKSLGMGEQMHCRVVKSSFDVSDIVVGNAIISMYIKSGSMASASKAFYSMQRRNLSSYQMLMMGYIQHKGNREALSLFYQMQQSGFHAKPAAFARILGGCADLIAINLGKQIHAFVVKMGLVSDTYIGNALLGMYAKSESMHCTLESPIPMPIEDDMEVRNEENTVEDFGQFKLEEEKENCYSYSVIKNIFPMPLYQMYGTPLFVHEAQSGLKMDLLAGDSMLDVHENDVPFEASSNMIREILSREVGWVYSLSKHAPVKFEALQVEGIIPEHVILLLIFSDVSNIGLVDERFNSAISLRRLEIDSNHRLSASA